MIYIKHFIDLIVASFTYPALADWNVYVIAIQRVLNGYTPYFNPPSDMGFYNPAWSLIFIYPLFILKNIPHFEILYRTIIIISYIIIFRKLGLSWFKSTLAILSPYTIFALSLGNISWMIPFGLFFHPAIGYLFFALKPQDTFVLMALIFYITYKKNGYKALLYTIPLIAMFILNVIIYEMPFNVPADHTFKFSFLPYSLPLAAILVYVAFKRKSYGSAIAASVMLSPYLSVSSLVWLSLIPTRKPIFKLMYLSIWIGVWYAIITNLMNSSLI